MREHRGAVLGSKPGDFLSWLEKNVRGTEQPHGDVLIQELGKALSLPGLEAPWPPPAPWPFTAAEGGSCRVETLHLGCREDGTCS